MTHFEIVAFRLCNVKLILDFGMCNLRAWFMIFPGVIYIPLFAPCSFFLIWFHIYHFFCNFHVCFMSFLLLLWGANHMLGSFVIMFWIQHCYPLLDLTESFSMKSYYHLVCSQGIIPLFTNAYQWSFPLYI